MKTWFLQNINPQDLKGGIPMGRTLTWGKSLAPMMLTQKTLWAEFLWAWRSHEENPWLWHQHRRLHGKNSYGQNVHMKKIPDSYDATQMTLWAEFLWAKRSHEEHPRLHWHQHRRHYGQNSYGRNACTRRKSRTLWRYHRKTQWAEFLWAKRSLEENPLLYWHQHGRLHGRNSYGRTLTWRKPRLHRC